MKKVWTYIINKPLSTDDLNSLMQQGETFVKSWTAHDNKLAAEFTIYKDRIIVIAVDETVANASGCSIDKLLRFIKELQAQYQVDLLNRLLVAYKNSDQVNVTSASAIPALMKEGKISADTIVYETAISNEVELNNWEKPLKETWLKKYLA